MGMIIGFGSSEQHRKEREETVKADEKRKAERRVKAEAECRRIFEEVKENNNAFGGRVAIRVLDNGEEGLLLRETVTQTVFGRPRRFAFAVFPDGIFKIGPITPNRVERAETALLEYRLARLILFGSSHKQPTEVIDLVIDGGRNDAKDLDIVLRASFNRGLQRTLEFLTSGYKMN